MRASAIGRMLFIVTLLLLSTAALAQVRITVAFAPPPIPVYEQPLCPGDSYIWVPGYWAWYDDFDDYYWVPGTWVLGPEVGYYWTPPWWGWDGGVYLFHAGFWGPVVAFYGGINYGFGYFGEGYVGGRWDNGRFFYNRSITNVNVTVIRNVYNEHVDIRNESRVSFNGGRGGINARPTAADEAAGRERHLPPVAAQEQHIQAARGNPELRANANHGKPSVAATARPGQFRGSQVVGAREAGGTYNRPEGARGGSRGANEGGRAAVHPNDLPPLNRPETGNTSSKEEQKFQKQQQKLYQQQMKDREKLQRQQVNEHAQQGQSANEARHQEMEQRHQQQTQEMVERHQTQTREMQSRQPGGQKPR